MTSGVYGRNNIGGVNRGNNSGGVVNDGSVVAAVSAVGTVSNGGGVGAVRAASVVSTVGVVNVRSAEVKGSVPVSVLGVALVGIAVENGVVGSEVDSVSALGKDLELVGSTVDISLRGSEVQVVDGVVGVKGGDSFSADEPFNYILGTKYDGSLNNGVVVDLSGGKRSVTISGE